MKKHLKPRKLNVALETVRELDHREPALIAVVGGQRPPRWTAASGQDACCA